MQRRFCGGTLEGNDEGKATVLNQSVVQEPVVSGVITIFEQCVLVMSFTADVEDVD
jgi:hypothetical protein